MRLTRGDASPGSRRCATDSAGRPVAVSGDAVHPTRTGYDSAGRKTSGFTTRDDGASWDETRWTYDPHTALNLAKNYADGTSVAYTYADDGKKLRTTWARGVWRENAYNADRNISSVTHSDGKTFVFGYDEQHRLASVSNDGFAYLYERHNLGCVTNEAVCSGEAPCVVRRTVDGRARVNGTAVLVTNVAYVAVTRRYDGENRLAAYTFTNGQGRACSVALVYEGSWLTNCAVTVPGGQTFNRRIVRDAHRRGLVRRNEWTFGGQPIFWSSSDYDLLGRATNSTDSVNAVREWLYNSRSEVSGARIGVMSFAYNYDSIGNRTAVSVGGVTEIYTANNLNQYTSSLRASASPRAYQYDADGNLTSDGVLAYAYDCENNLVSVQPVLPTSGAVRVSNGYDHLNRRIRKTVERYEDGEWIADRTTTFVYDGWNLLLERAETANGVTDTREYFWGPDLSGTEQGAGGVGGLLAVSINGTFYFPCYDHNGNVMCYVSETGEVAASYLYDAFGNTIVQSGSLADTFRHRFSTKYLDTETSHYYYGRRFYIPVLGRWPNRDPIEEEGGENLYAFCSNSPSTLIDNIGNMVFVNRHRKGKVPSGGWGTVAAVGYHAYGLTIARPRMLNLVVYFRDKKYRINPVSEPDRITHIDVYYYDIVKDVQESFGHTETQEGNEKFAEAKSKEYGAAYHEELHVNVWKDYDSSLVELEIEAKNVAECLQSSAEERKRGLVDDMNKIYLRAINRNKEIDSNQPKWRE